MEVEMTKTDALNWYAIQVKPLKEKTAAAFLDGKGYESFLPMQLDGAACRRSSHKPLPLFPGYLFCRLNLADRRAHVVTTPCVLGILGAGKTPLPVPDVEVESLRLLLRASRHVEQEGSLHTGMRVRICNGPFAGIEGILSERRLNRLVVQITLFGRGVSIQVDDRDLIPTEPIRPLAMRDVRSKISLFASD
jgi:transcription antitermination factor NusG